MHVVSINVGEQERLLVGERTKETGIRKQPVERAVINTRGLVDDEIVDLENHGGPDQAVYVYSTDDYDWWAAELGRDDLHPGLFGENLTLDLGGQPPFRIGDRLEVGGDVVLEVTAPRIPCAKFATAVGEPNWVARFNAARRHGAYCRVLSGGLVEVGDRVHVEPADRANPDVEDLAEIALDRDLDPVHLRAALDAPIAERARGYVERRLARLERGGD